MRLPLKSGAKNKFDNEKGFFRVPFYLSDNSKTFNLTFRNDRGTKCIDTTIWRAPGIGNSR